MDTKNTQNINKNEKNNKGLVCAQKKEETIFWFSLIISFLLSIALVCVMLHFSEQKSENGVDEFTQNIIIGFSIIFIYMPVITGIFYNLFFLFFTRKDSKRVFEQVYETTRKKTFINLIWWIVVFVFGIIYSILYILLTKENYKEHLFDIFTLFLFFAYISVGLVIVTYNTWKTINKKCE